MRDAVARRHPNLLTGVAAPFVGFRLLRHQRPSRPSSSMRFGPQGPRGGRRTKRASVDSRLTRLRREVSVRRDRCAEPRARAGGLRLVLARERQRRGRFLATERESKEPLGPQSYPRTSGVARERASGVIHAALCRERGSPLHQRIKDNKILGSSGTSIQRNRTTNHRRPDIHRNNTRCPAIRPIRRTSYCMSLQTPPRCRRGRHRRCRSLHSNRRRRESRLNTDTVYKPSRVADEGTKQPLSERSPTTSSEKPLLPYTPPNADAAGKRPSTRPSRPALLRTRP
jgi:hypothetical protein